MKRTGTCPKCGAKDILRIPGAVGPHGSGNNISVGWTIFGSVKVSRYLCTECGYIEEWVDGREDIEKLKRRYRQPSPPP